MTRKHTQGEWKNTLTGIKSDKGLLIAQCWYGESNNSFGRIPAVPSHEEFCANGNIIAAAPEMIDVIERVEKYFVDLQNRCALTPSEEKLWSKVAAVRYKAVGNL